MSARCPEGHLSHDPDYCDQCGIRIMSGQDNYGYRPESPGAGVGSYGTGQPAARGSDGYGRRGQPDPAAPPSGGAGGYDQLGIRRGTADTPGRGDPSRADGAGPRGADPYGHGSSGYEERTPRSYPADSYEQPGYAPRGRDGLDPAGYTPRGRDDVDGGGYAPRGRDDVDAAGYQPRGRDDLGAGGYSPRGRDGLDGGGYGARSRDDLEGGAYGARSRDEFGRDPYARDGADGGYPTSRGREDVARDPYGSRGGGYEADPLGLSGGAPAPAAPDRTDRGSASRYLSCPNCRALYEPGARFCETCGLDFTTGHMPGVTGPGAGSAPPAPSARRHSDPGGGYAESAGSGYADPAGVGYAEPAESLGGSAAGWSGQAVATSWEAVVEAERDYYDSGDDHRVPFPSFYPRRVFPLTGARLLVGRRSESRGIHPEIDLSGAPEDPGISRAHAILERRADGGYALLDPGSTNGTRLNDEPDPVEAGAPIPLQDGDRVYLGAWTRITVRAR